MLVEAKSNLAKLMASENIYVEQSNVETASFNLETRVLTVPVLNGNLSPELYDLLLGHEVGHALETPERGWHDSIIDLKVNKSILNVCEDVRIEKKIKRKFPGIRISFLKGYKELLEMDFFGIKDEKLEKFNFIDRINLHTKCGASLGIKFTASEKIILQEVENTETFDEVVVVARKIQKLMEDDKSIRKDDKQNETKEGEQKSKLTIVLKDSDDESKGSEGSGETVNPDDYDEVEIIDERTKPTEEGDDSKDDEEVKSSGKMGSGYTESKTDNSFREKEKKLHSKENNRDISYVNIPELRLDNIVIPYKELYKKFETCIKSPNAFRIKYNPVALKENYRKFRQDSNKVVSYLVKEFELRKNAEQQARAQVSRTGELNMSRLHDYKFTDDIFRRMTKVPQGKSHGLVMYIDWSGSMAEHLNSTVKQLLNLVMFCRKVNIPFEVYAFTSYNKTKFDNMNNWRREVSYELQNPKDGDLIVEDFSLLNLFSNKMNNKEFTDAASYLLDFGTAARTGHYCTNFYPPEFFTLSGTPLNQAVISAFRMVAQFKAANRLEIVNTVFLSDGEGQLLSRKYCRKGLGSTYDAVPSSRTKVIYRDTVTRATYKLDEELGQRCFATMQTTALLKLLKQRLDCNLIGFYVCSTREVRPIAKIYTSNYNVAEKCVSNFKDNNFAVIDGSGYDDYYLIRSDKMDTDDNEFEVKSTTTRALVNSFSKYTGNKVGSRVVLNRFINLIT